MHVTHKVTLDGFWINLTGFFFASNIFTIFFKNHHLDISEKALEKGIATISKNLDRQVSKGTLTEEEKSATLARIKSVTSLKEGVEKSDAIKNYTKHKIRMRGQSNIKIDRPDAFKKLFFKGGRKTMKKLHTQKKKIKSNKIWLN